MPLLWEPVKRHGWLLLCVLLTGCLHQEQIPPLAPQAKTPNIYLPPPTDAKLPPMQSGNTPPNLTDAKPVAAAEEAKPKKRPKRQQTVPVAAAAPPPAAPPVAEAPMTPPTTLGALAPGGGNSNPRQQQEIMGKIGTVEKRISDLPTTTADHEQKQLAKVRQFLKEASDALKGGDVEGAEILATKADLLMDDLTK